MISLNDFVRQWNDVRTDAISVFEQTGASGWYILGHQVQHFERDLASYWGLQHAVGVASGLDALEISLRTLGCGAGDKVLTTPISAFATTLAILKLEAIPVFVDVDEFGLLDLNAARKALRRDSAIRYLVPVHLYGHSLDLARLKGIQDEAGVTVVEDCAQSIGATFNGTPTGCVGTLAATSFYPTKNLGAMGDGGAILARNAEHERVARVLRDYGQTGKYQHDLVGYNSRLDELQAALLRQVSLPRLNGWITQRRRIAAAYIAGISNQAVQVPGCPPESESCWHLFPVLVDHGRKSDFLAHLLRNGIAAGEHYPVAIPDQKVMRTAKFEVFDGCIERARVFCERQVSLPIHPYLTDSEVSKVIEAVNGWRA